MSESLSFAGKRALVTGGGRGIGAAIARELAARGAAVAVNYVANSASANALVDELKTAGSQAVALQADVGDPAQVKDLISKVTTELGGLDVVASNAGVEHFGPLENITKDDFDKVFHINVAGQLFVAQGAAAAMNDGGRILLTSSISARISVYQHTLYAASKAAVSAMVLNLAPELAERGIAINAIAPGGTATDMAREVAKAYTPPSLRDVPSESIVRSMNAIGRLAEPQEIARVAAFLLSSDASYVTGATMDVSGGYM